MSEGLVLRFLRLRSALQRLLLAGNAVQPPAAAPGQACRAFIACQLAAHLQDSTMVSLYSLDLALVAGAGQLGRRWHGPGGAHLCESGGGRTGRVQTCSGISSGRNRVEKHPICSVPLVTLVLTQGRLAMPGKAARCMPHVHAEVQLRCTLTLWPCRATCAAAVAVAIAGPTAGRGGRQQRGHGQHRR